MGAFMLVRKGNKIVRKEGVVVGAADENVANNIDLVIQNEYRLYKQMKALVDNLVKKSGKGIELDKEKLVKSSVVDQLVREAIRICKKDYEDYYDDGSVNPYNYISTATRNLAKQFVAETILRKVEDNIRFDQLNNK